MSEAKTTKSELLKDSLKSAETKTLKKIKNTLIQVYGHEKAECAYKKMMELFDAKRESETAEESLKVNCGRNALSEDDATLICYANSVASRNGISPLGALKKFYDNHDLKKAFSSTHLLPFFPWDTDRGFSVKDYYEVAEENGTWDDIEELSKSTELMFDFVANHASIRNPIVQKAILAAVLPKDHPKYDEVKKFKDFVFVYTEENKPTDDELSALSRPRAYPALTPFIVFEKDGELLADLENKDHVHVKRGEIDLIGTGYVWTTFSRGKREDGTEKTRQVDLNFLNPLVLVESLKILMFYAEKKARFIRLDAIGYIWKQIGRPSIHEDQCHLLLEVIKDFLSLVTPEVVTVAEVNEAQEMFFRYLGKGDHEQADLVYQFTHFPLAVYGLHTGDASYYKEWLKTIGHVEGRQFVTILGSHDGLGLKPVRGILPESEIERFGDILVDEYKAMPNYAYLPGGKRIVYEACGTPWDLINKSDLDLDTAIKRYKLVVAMGLTVRGIPGIYINGLLGANNYFPEEGLDENRTVNREIFSYNALTETLNDKSSQESRVFEMVKELLAIRRRESAFSLNAKAIIIPEYHNQSIVAAELFSADNMERILCCYNVSSEPQRLTIPKLTSRGTGKWKNLLEPHEERCFDREVIDIELEPYQALWLKKVED